MSRSGARAFPSTPPGLDLPALERAVLKRWEAGDVFKRSLAQTADGPAWHFYEGPPTANGAPGTHHVEARVFKDLFPRYRTMKGYHVDRRAGWDCHGLPVELAVEKELGFTSKQDIVSYGVAEFNAKCRESALRHVADFERMTTRMGYWVDMDRAYMTMSTQYVESVWWALQQIHAKGLLVEDFRVTPYCPRDETALSDHEVAQGYEDVDDPSVYVRFPLLDGPLAERGAHLLVWTTTPWTLISNTAVAVGPDITYALVDDGQGGSLVLAQDLVGSVLGDGARVLETFPGSTLLGLHYRRPFELVPAQEFGPPPAIIPADYVTTDSGSGLVHQAPAFGAEDFAACRRYGYAVVNPIGSDGHFRADLDLIGGTFFKAADRPIVEDLRARGLLFRELTYRHSYPHCWRCHTPLIYYPLPAWYIRTTQIKDRLLAENERTDWHPEHIKDGRYGGWLQNNVDWALSRNRFWGTPLPVWRCEAGHDVCVGSLAELGSLAGQDLSALDPHRPYVDDVVVPCGTCGQPARRVPEVIDVWFDSGSMPFAQWGAPHRNRAEFEKAYPAQYICEAVDQTRGWFYSLMAVGTLLFDRSSYDTVLCLGLILDAEGRKMSKHLGNVLDPFDLFEQHGADPLRWLMLTNGSPWVDRRVSHEALEDVTRKLVLPYWNTVSFLVLYANASGWTPADGAPAPAQRPAMDRWLLAELADVVDTVDGALDRFDSALAGRRLSAFVEDLSNWYVRRSRRRFWQGEPAALATLHEVLGVLTRLLAPFVPFVTDEVWSRLEAGLVDGSADSVHLAVWPTVAADLGTEARDDRLREQMAVVRRVVDLGRAARVTGGVRTRQPLSRAVVVAPGFADLGADMLAEIADELNVGAVQAPDADLVDATVKPNFRALGKRFGKRTPLVAKAVEAAAAPRDGSLTIFVDGEELVLTGEEFSVVERPREGWTVTTEGDVSVGLDTVLTDDLVRAGLLRDAIRSVQEARKGAGLEVTDRIALTWSTPRADLAGALQEGRDLLAREVLAVAVTQAEPGPGDVPVQVEALDLTVVVRRQEG